MCAYITTIGTANPRYKILQRKVLNFMVKAHGLNKAEAHKLEVLYRASGIHQRFTTIDDYNKTDGFSFYPDNDTLEPFPDTAKRGDWFKKEALALSIEAVQNCLGDKKVAVSHLIVVSCTGMYAPGLDIDLVNHLGLPHSTERTAINFMGCYASFNALKLANHICRGQENANVLIVSTELCSLHFQKDKSEDSLLANAIFGDGSAAVLVQSTPAPGVSLEMEAFISDMLPSAKHEMAWEIGNFGFEMKLSAYVPEAINGGIQPLINSLRKRAGKSEFDFYAVHPGGKKILDVVESVLGISKQDNKFSREVLWNYGNMSSPTILFVLQQILAELDSTDMNKSLLSFAFGPGLTLESMIARVVVA